MKLKLSVNFAASNIKYSLILFLYNFFFSCLVGDVIFPKKKQNIQDTNLLCKCLFFTNNNLLVMRRLVIE